MGWTFTEFDRQPADEVLRYYQLKGLHDEIMAKRQAGDGG